MNILRLLSLISILLALSGCTGGARTYLAVDDDEDYGIGGTGLQAQNIGSEGIGIIGEITGFGSIFVNGFEIENDGSTIIGVNGRKVLKHEFEIGEVVEVLTPDERPLTNAVLINVRHEVIGPVSEIDRARNRFTILNQEVLVENLPANVETGAFLAISGFRDGDGQIHATRIAAARAGSVLFRGQLERSQDGLSMYGYDLAFPVQPEAENREWKIEGILVDGKVKVTRAFPDRIAGFKRVSNWVLQGFPGLYATAWKDSEGLKKISGQSKPVIFRVRRLQENKPAKVSLLPDNLPQGAKVSDGQQNPGPGNQSSPGRGGGDSSGSGNGSGGNGNGPGGSGNGSGGSGNN